MSDDSQDYDELLKSIQDRYIKEEETRLYFQYFFFY